MTVASRVDAASGREGGEKGGGWGLTHPLPPPSSSLGTYEGDGGRPFFAPPSPPRHNSGGSNDDDA